MPSNDLRLLALDGGGVRGLSALMILEKLMESIDADAPPKPCDYFDMIGGTSTGGIIAIMLGRLKMSIDECIDAYMSLSSNIFQRRKHIGPTEEAIQGRFDAGELERVVKDIVEERGLQPDALLKDTPDAKCKVFVCATSKETSDIVCLTSYRSPRGGSDLLNSVKIWEACRATSATSSFFEPIAVGRYKEEFADGATGANNPVIELWNQAQMIWGPEPLDSKVQCIVSIGTGIPSLKPFQDVLYIGETLVALATETEQTAERFRRDKTHLDTESRYFRFNVVRGLEDIGLEEASKARQIAAVTRRYVESQETFKQIQACAANLRGENKPSQPEPPKNPFEALMAASSGTPAQQLIDAVKDDDAPLVQELLQKGIDPNSRSFEGLTALWWACKMGFTSVVEVLLATGKVKPNGKDGYLVTPLYWAVKDNHEGVVKLLLTTNSVDVNIKTTSMLQRTPLHWAVENGNEAMVRLLLESGKANVDAKDTLNKTPVEMATAKGNKRIIRLLQAYKPQSADSSYREI